MNQTKETTIQQASSERFHELLGELGELHNKKQADYGRYGDPFANVRASTEWGMPAWVGAMVRATDKIKRLQKFAQSGALANEGVEDSFRDLAVYTIIGLVLYEEERDKQLDKTLASKQGNLPFEEQRRTTTIFQGVQSQTAGQG